MERVQESNLIVIEDEVLIDLEEIKPKTSKIRIVGDVSRRESMIRVIRDYEDGVRRPQEVLNQVQTQDDPNRFARKGISPDFLIDLRAENNEHSDQGLGERVKKKGRLRRLESSKQQPDRKEPKLRKKGRKNSGSVALAPSSQSQNSPIQKKIRKRRKFNGTEIVQSKRVQTRSSIRMRNKQGQFEQADVPANKQTEESKPPEIEEEGEEQKLPAEMVEKSEIIAKPKKGKKKKSTPEVNQQQDGIQLPCTQIPFGTTYEQLELFQKQLLDEKILIELKGCTLGNDVGVFQEDKVIGISAHILGVTQCDAKMQLFFRVDFAERTNGKRPKSVWLTKQQAIEKCKDELFEYMLEVCIWPPPSQLKP